MEAYCLLTFSHYWMILVTFKHDHSRSLTCYYLYYKTLPYRSSIFNASCFSTFNKEYHFGGQMHKKTKNILYAINSEGLMHTTHIYSGLILTPVIFPLHWTEKWKMHSKEEGKIKNYLSVFTNSWIWLPTMQDKQPPRETPEALKAPGLVRAFRATRLCSLQWQ